jgi:choline dehydrogenase
MHRDNTLEADYVIVGAGSAGCVLASRLTEDAGVSVLLIEAGGPDRGWKIHMPAALAYPLQDDRVNWSYHSEPEPHMAGRRLYCPRGKVLGGSSSINGMAYVRGHAFDYDRWAQAPGLADWRYAACLPYFKRAEALDIGGDAWRGADGPLRVTAGRMDNPLHRAWVEAGREAGYPVTVDMNGAAQEGVGRMDMTVGDGERWSAAKAYLRPALRRDGLTVLDRSRAMRLLVEGRKVLGVEVERGGARIEVRARREVIVSAGAIDSPKLLLLSGLGPAQPLRDLGVEVVRDLPGVGANLQDHLEVYVQYACRKPVSLYAAQKPWNKAWIGVRWLLTRTGPGATSHFESGGFIRSEAGVRHPDLQIHFLPIAVNYDGSNPRDTHGFQAHVGPMRPTSRGSVTLRSTDHREAPRLVFDYLASERDRWEMRQGIRLVREIIAQPAFDRLRGEELSPGAGVEDDEGLDRFAAERAESAYHPACTCAMGEGPDAVVDGQGRVHGVGGLRVVDASIMPSIVSGNLNAPTIMLAEKLADVIRGRPPLPALDPASGATVEIDPDWESRQRPGAPVRAGR